MKPTTLLIALGLFVAGQALTYSIATSSSSSSGTTTVVEESATIPETGLKAEKITKDKVIRIKNLNTRIDNTVYLNTVVNYQTVELVLEALQYINKNVGRAYLVIDSPGGSVLDGVRLSNYIRYIGDVVTVCEGLCASMGAQIHQSGKERLMTPGSVLMFHPASGGAQGTIEQMQNQITAFQRLVDRLDIAVAKRAGIKYEDFKARLTSELWLETQDAMAENFVDGIVALDVSFAKESSYDIAKKARSLGIKLEDTAASRARNNYK